METLTGIGGGGTSVVVGRVAKNRLRTTGDILVTEYTDPQLIEDMSRASAVVTDIGGVLCHAAIVCREQSIPFVVGTEKATSWLKTGDFVEVDPMEGTVKLVE